MSEGVVTLAPYFWRDLAAGLQQQMYFWGQDVIRPEGNFLVEQGFRKSASTGLKGTSCYRLDWQGGHIELYGSCAGWYGKEGGFTFIRPKKSCFYWDSGTETPIPGKWESERLESRDRARLYLVSGPFLDWLIAYEEAVKVAFGEAYREENFRNYKKVPNATPWIEPSAALSWFRSFRSDPAHLTRPKAAKPAATKRLSLPRPFQVASSSRLR